MKNTVASPNDLINILSHKYNDLILNPIRNPAENLSVPLENSKELALFILISRDSILALLLDENYNKALHTNLINFFCSIIYDKNQYLELPLDFVLEIKNSYSSFLEKFTLLLKKCSKDDKSVALLSELFYKHYENLTKIISVISKTINMSATNKNELYNSPICSEYSADFQAKILSLDVSDLNEPILDIGCGKNAVFVRFLKNLGYDVTGFDRNILNPGNHLIATDWFNFEFKKNYWGTIISQMAFSNHFIYNHLYIHGKPDKYAKLYMAILSSLKSGGSFYYAPGLPFIEQFLSKEEYQITKNAIDYEFLIPEENFSKEFKDEYLYSVRILKE